MELHVVNSSSTACRTTVSNCTQVGQYVSVCVCVPLNIHIGTELTVTKRNHVEISPQLVTPHVEISPQWRSNLTHRIFRKSAKI
jgi:hypothetical protein